MTTKELLNPNLHLTFTVKLSCDNKVWRRHAAFINDGSADLMKDDLSGALKEAVEGVFRKYLGRESTDLADYTFDVVDDDKSPIFAYRWNGCECVPCCNGEELPYKLITRYVVDLPARTYGDPRNCNPEEGHWEWCILDGDGFSVEQREGDERSCEEAFEKLMNEETK